MQNYLAHIIDSWKYKGSLHSRYIYDFYCKKFFIKNINLPICALIEVKLCFNFFN